MFDALPNVGTRCDTQVSNYITIERYRLMHNNNNKTWYQTRYTERFASVIFDKNSLQSGAWREPNDDELLALFLTFEDQAGRDRVYNKIMAQVSKRRNVGLNWFRTLCVIWFETNVPMSLCDGNRDC